MAGVQYLKGLNQNILPAAMHDLPAMYARVHDIIATMASRCFLPDGNTRTYPKPPTLTDLEVIALAATAEALEIDSENLLYAKLLDYPDFLPQRCGRQAFNRRRRRLRRYIDHVNATLADWLDNGQELLMVDSMPIETVRITRADKSRACRDPHQDVWLADKTYHSSTKRWIMGYKLHAIFTSSGIYVEHVVRPASQHDLTVLRELIDLRARTRRTSAEAAPAGRQSLRLRARTTAVRRGVRHRPTSHSKENSKDWKPWPIDWIHGRRYIETIFSQLCDETRAKVNRAKRFAGLNTRISTKLLIRTIKQFVNHHTGRSINQTKYCWMPVT